MSIHIGSEATANRTLEVGGKTYHYFHPGDVIPNYDTLPRILRPIAEQLVRLQDGERWTTSMLGELRSGTALMYRPARVLVQDYTGGPLIVDIFSMRDAVAKKGGDPSQLDLAIPMDLVVDHSIVANHHGTAQALALNEEREFADNGERYQLFATASGAFDQLRVVPPGVGICHQVNLEYISQGVLTVEVGGEHYAFFDSCAGADSHTQMINSLGIFSMGAGGLEIEVYGLGEPIEMALPKYVRVELKGSMPRGMTGTDLVLEITKFLRDAGLVGAYVEFFGEGVSSLSVENRATITNMAPEFGVGAIIFPVDERTLEFMKKKGKSEQHCALYEAYAKALGTWNDPEQEATIVADRVLEFDLSSVKTVVAGPNLPHQRMEVASLPASIAGSIAEVAGLVEGQDHGLLALASITSCTNTSNPALMFKMALVAKAASERGMKVPSWVKTTFAPGSREVTLYLKEAGLMEHMEALGFFLVGYGCTACIGNAGLPLEPEMEGWIEDGLQPAGVLTGNRNFAGRIHPNIPFNYLAGADLVIAYALAGRMTIDIESEPIGQDSDGNDVYFHELVPTDEDIQAHVDAHVGRDSWERAYSPEVLAGSAEWQALGGVEGQATFNWSATSTYVQPAPWLDYGPAAPGGVFEVEGAYALALCPDSTTTDVFSPAGNFKAESPAGRFLVERQVAVQDFNTLGARRGNSDVMIRAGMSNVRFLSDSIPEELRPESQVTGMTYHVPSGEVLPVFDAAQRYQESGTAMILIGGIFQGTGSSRDWAPKALVGLGVSAYIAKSFEKIFRQNAFAMGLPLFTFAEGEDAESLGLDGTEVYDISVPELTLGCTAEVTATKADGTTVTFTVHLAAQTEDEIRLLTTHGNLLVKVVNDTLADQGIAA